MNGKTWLIGGTSDSATVANVLITANVFPIVSTATETARSLYPDRTEVAVGRMSLERMTAFCQQQNITKIVDASHPYAVDVSLQAIAVAARLQIPYLRYERACYQPESVKDGLKAIELDCFERLLEGDYLLDRRVLLTIGCQALPLFKPWQSRATLFARVLPKIESLEIAFAAGFTSDRLAAIRPPISIAMETALWQQWQISLVVTKASGKAGGEDIKRQVSANLGVPLIIITRPQVAYPQQTSEISTVLNFCQRSL